MGLYEKVGTISLDSLREELDINFEEATFLKWLCNDNTQQGAGKKMKLEKDRSKKLGKQLRTKFGVKTNNGLVHLGTMHNVHKMV